MRTDRPTRRAFPGLVLLAVVFVIGGCAKTPREALQSTLERQCHTWRGEVTVLDSAGTSRTLPLTYTLAQAGEDDYVGSMSAGEDGSGRSASVRFYRGDDARWVGTVGPDAQLAGQAPIDLSDRPEKRTVNWVGKDARFKMWMDREAMKMTIDGVWPLSDRETTGEPLWMSARLRRDAFRLTLGPFEITIMECLGILATLFFASRFLIQWVASERQKRSVMPELFWWVSLGGAALMLTYGIYFGRFAVVLGQLTGWIVYIRNIWFIEMEKRRARQEERDIIGAPSPGGSDDSH